MTLLVRTRVHTEKISLERPLSLVQDWVTAHCIMLPL